MECSNPVTLFFLNLVHSLHNPLLVQIQRMKTDRILSVPFYVPKCLQREIKIYV
jgi:hypothetical protein